MKAKSKILGFLLCLLALNSFAHNPALGDVGVHNSLHLTTAGNVLADTIYCYGFEYGGLGWWSTDWVWEIGQESVVAPHSGDSCAGTVLNGKYPEHKDSRLVSPAISLPAIGSTEALHLHFWHWFKISRSYDYVRVEISWDSSGVWTPWKAKTGNITSASSVWSPADLDISNYAGKRVRFGFLLHSSHYNDWGWYIDDVCVFTTSTNCIPAPVCLDFEEGWEGWWANYGVWQIGHPDSAIAVPHSGECCAATVLNGKYPEHKDSRLVTPAICLPNIDEDNEALFLGIWHWYRISQHYDYARVEISCDSAGVWQPFVAISPQFKGAIPKWLSYEVRLSAYAGKTVRLGFYLHSSHYDDWGWYIDDVSLDVCRDSIAVLEPNGTECREAGVLNTVIWSWADTSGTFQYVHLELSRDGGKTWETLADSVSNNGFWQGTIGGPASNRCLIRISDAADGIPWDVSDGFFSIGKEAIFVTSPNGGETLLVDSTYSITWNSCVFTGKVQLEYSADGGAAWTTIAPSSDNDGSEDWIVPSTASNHCLVRISDVTDGDPADTSDSFFTIESETGVSEDQEKQRFALSLAQNFPNPFNPNTCIQFSLPVSGKVSLKIYNLLGQEVRTLLDQDAGAREYKVFWDGKDNSGTKVSSGIYFYRLKVRDFVETKKMVLLK